MKWTSSVLMMTVLVTGMAACSRLDQRAEQRIRIGNLVSHADWAEPTTTNNTVEPKLFYTAPQANRPPEIDGVLDDPCWNTAPVMSNFVVYQNESILARVPTSARIAFTRDAIYLGFMCTEPKMNTLRTAATKRDGNVWHDDCVELWLDVNYNRRSTFHFLFNSLGTVCDLREWDQEVDDPLAIQAGAKKIIHKGEVEWNGPCEVKTSKGKDFWTVEVAIPARSLGVEQIIPGSRWGLNAARTRRSGGAYELSSWSGVFVTPISRFGAIQLGQSDYDFKFMSLGNQALGNNVLVLSVANRTNTAKQLRIKVEAVSGKNTRETKNLNLAAGEKKQIALPYTLSNPGRAYSLTVAGTDLASREKVLFRKYEGIVPRVMSFKLNSPELYIGEQKEMKGAVTINLGDADMAASFLSFELFNGQNELLRRNRLGQPHANGILTFTIADLKKEDDYSLRVELFDEKGHSLAHDKAVFHLMEAPF